MRIPDHVRTVLFDLDGTLIDHYSAARAGVLEFAAQHRPDLGEDEVLKRWFKIERRWYDRFERGVTSHDGQRIGRLREFLERPDMSESDALSTFDDYIDAYRRSWQAFPDAASILDRALASGRDVGIFTNGANPMQLNKVRDTGLYRDGIVMLTAPELGAAKPQPGSYAAALQRMGCEEASTSVVIGDDFRNDVEGARKAGMLAVFVDRGGKGDVASLDEIEF